MSDYEQNEFDSLFDDSGFVSRSEAKQLATDTVQKTLRDISTLNAQAIAGQQAAIREVSALHPDFEQRRSQMLAVLQEIPLLRDAVASAETNPQLSQALPQIYEVVYRASQAPTQSNTATASTASEPSKLESQDDLSDESTQYRAALASQRVDLSPQNRKALIAELEKRGVGDIEF